MQGENRITSHLHHIATSDIAYRRTSDQAQARPGGQDKDVGHFLKQKNKQKKKRIKNHSLSLALTLTPTCTVSPNH